LRIRKRFSLGYREIGDVFGPSAGFDMRRLENRANSADNKASSVIRFHLATVGAGPRAKTPMPRYPNVTIKTKLYGLILFSTLALAALLGLSLWVMHQYLINGPLYEQLIRRTSALAELEPSSFDLAEPYLLLLELSTTTDAGEIEELKKQFAAREAHLRDREAYWTEKLTEGPIRSALRTDIVSAANEFYRAAKEEFLPLVHKGDRPRLGQVLAEKIKPRYLTQRQNVERAVRTARQTIENWEKLAAQRTEFWLSTMIFLSIGSVVVTSLFGWVLARSILRPTQSLIERVHDMAGGASDLTARVPIETHDELGLLADGINGMIYKIQTIVQRIREASVQLLSTAAQIGAAARQQETTIQTLGSSTAEIAASVREITATSKELSTTMNEVSERSDRVAGLADAGRSRLENMESAVQQLVTATASVSGKLGVIREKADGINMVVTTITKVADQTNLLSINAAIEAEKAGEYGRGFLVVAREIRRLADQTAVATLDIDNMVRHMQDAVSAGVMQMDKFSEEVRIGVARIAELSGQMGQIIEEVHTLSDRFRLVNEGVRNQALGADQINDAMTQVTAVTQQTRGAIEEFKESTEHLRGSVHSINQEVGQFKV
jgi:methyl-accepting chemotaxis protein WspA